MKNIVAVLLLAIFGLACCERHNASFVETVKEIVHDGRKAVGENVAEMGEKVKEAMEEFLDDTDDYLDGHEENITEPMGIDSEGCNRGLRKSLEDKCDAVYDKVNEEAQQIEDDKKKLEAVCCALEDFEKCSLHAYDKANCATDKTAIRENLRAARLFLSVVANITCNEFRGQCAHYASDAGRGDASHTYLGFSQFFLMSGAFIVTLLV